MLIYIVDHYRGIDTTCKMYFLNLECLNIFCIFGSTCEYISNTDNMAIA